MELPCKSYILNLVILIESIFYMECSNRLSQILHVSLYDLNYKLYFIDLLHNEIQSPLMASSCKSRIFNQNCSSIYKYIHKQDTSYLNNLTIYKNNIIVNYLLYEIFQVLLTMLWLVSMISQTLDLLVYHIFLISYSHIIHIHH